MNQNQPTYPMLWWGCLALCLPFLWQCAPITQLTTKGFRPTGISAAALTSNVKTPSQGRRIALLIGINQYKDKTWHPLRYAAKDAKDLAGVLKRGELGNFDVLSLHVSSKETTRRALLAAFAKLAKLSTGPKDTIFVYISGHGTLARNASHQLKRYVVTSDASSKSIPNTAVSVDFLKKQFNALKSQRKVMLLATCHSGNGKSRLNRKMKAELKTIKAPFFMKPMESVSRATVFLGVCGFGETAQESPRLRNDVYTHYFIKALKHRYDVNGDGAITVSEAHDYAKELTYHHTKGRQRAYAESDILGTDPIVLVGKKKRPGKPVLYAYTDQYFGVEVRVNGVAKGTFPRGIKMDSGKQRVTLVAKGNRKIFDGQVDLRPGERMEVQRLFGRRVFDYSLAVKTGYQVFLQGSSEHRLTRPLMLLGADFRFHRPLKMPLDLRFEFAFARDSHVLEEQDNRPQTVTEFNFGFAATYGWHYRQFSVFVGPRLSAIYLHRQSGFHQNLNDSFYSFQPGLVAGTEIYLHQRWSLFAEARLNYTYVTTEDGSARHQGSYELFGGLFFHF